MRPVQFHYHRPQSLQEAVRLLASNDEEECKALAGGHSLIPAMNQRLAQPGTLVDVGRLEELKGIRFEGGSLRIGALATHAEIASSPLVQAHCPALATAAGLIGDPQVRAWGTIGGNLAHADPASDPPAVVLAWGARMNLHGPQGERSVAADDFFIGLFTTALAPAELITSIDIPSQPLRRSAYAKMVHPASRYALLGVCVSLQMENGRCTDARVAVGGAIPKASRCPGAEGALSDSSLDDQALNAAAEAISQDLGDDVISDIHAPGEYRRAMAGVYLKRAVRASLSA